MNASDLRFGFRIVGKTCEPRRLVDAGAALAAYAVCDPRAECGREAYLSAFRFAADFADHLKATGSTAGFSGPCWSPWLWWDIDAEELHHAHQDAGALAAFLVERYAVEPDEPLLFFSGAKGFHLGLTTALWSPSPKAEFHRTARRFAEHVAALAAVTIDTGVYDRVRAFRAPNSRHPKTGLYKRRLSFDELLGPLDAILELAKAPAPFDVPQVTRTSEQAAADWQAAAALVASEGEAKAARRAAGNGSPTLNRSTLDFIREGAGAGDRHRLLFSAAANLAEFDCPPALAAALLEEPGLDSGLPPKDVRRQIECGLATGYPLGASPLLLESTQQAAAASTQDALDGSTVKEPLQVPASDSGSSEGQSCQQVTGATDPKPPAALQAALARLWGSTPAPKAAAPSGAGDAAPQPSAIDGRSSPAVLPPLPSALMPLPPGAVGSGTLDKPCRCGSTEFVEMPIPEGRTRRDCRKCGRFVGFGKWYDQGGPTR
jgi:hypothetical protein